MTNEQKAEKGYEKYGDFVGWKNYAGLPMPKWHELPEKIRGAWLAHTTFVVEQTLTEQSSV